MKLTLRAATSFGMRPSATGRSLPQVYVSLERTGCDRKGTHRVPASEHVGPGAAGFCLELKTSEQKVTVLYDQSRIAEGNPHPVLLLEQRRRLYSNWAFPANAPSDKGKHA